MNERRSDEQGEERPSAPERSALDRVADAAVVTVAAVPVLAIVATVAALAELALGRMAWHGFTEVWPHPDVLELGRWARFPRNLAAIAGVGSLVLALLAFLRLPGYAPIGRRLAVAAFSGIFVPSVVVAALLPRDNLRPKLVIFGLAAANVLVWLIAVTGLRHRAGGALRAALGFAAAATFLTLTVVGLGQIASADAGQGPVNAFLTLHAEGAQNALLALRHAGEACWWLALVASAVAVAMHGDTSVRQRRLVGGIIAVVIAIGLLFAFQQIVGHRFRFVLFGSFRLGLFVDEAPGLYSLPLGLGLGAGVWALVQRESATRQLGAATLLWLAAGFAPHTPIQLLYLVLASLLYTRTAQAWDPQGAWRQRQPWARIMGRSQPPPKPEAPTDPAVPNETFDDLGRAK